MIDLISFYRESLSGYSNEAMERRQKMREPGLLGKLKTKLFGPSAKQAKDTSMGFAQGAYEAKEHFGNKLPDSEIEKWRAGLKVGTYRSGYEYFDDCLGKYLDSKK